MPPTRLLTVDPGHFHAALVQKTMLPGVDPVALVHATPGPDLDAHLTRIAAFNSRAKNPTSWDLRVISGSEPDLHALREQADVVILAGRNRHKIRRIHAALSAGFHVLADKPWILTPEDLPLLRECLRLARQSGLVATDILTERHEVSSLLQCELVNQSDLIGTIERIEMTSVHGLIKTVSGAPLRRPLWFFDLAEQGEALTDLGIHLVDLVQWMLRPNQEIALEELAIQSAYRWPTELTRDDFERITGKRDFPTWTEEHRRGDRLLYPGNHRLEYTLGGVPVHLEIRWDRECPHGDSHHARIQGSLASVEIRQGPEEGHRPEVYVVPRDVTHPAVRYPLPSERPGHEDHFAAVARQFLHDLNNPTAVPPWEDSYTLARYWVTTQGAALARTVTT